jgi:hypothetical protein
MQPSVLVKPITPPLAAKDKTAAAKKLGGEFDDGNPFK